MLSDLITSKGDKTVEETPEKNSADFNQVVWTLRRDWNKNSKQKRKIQYKTFWRNILPPEKYRAYIKFWVGNVLIIFYIWHRVLIFFSKKMSTDGLVF